MSLITNQKQLADTIESLERRIKKHEEVLYHIKEIMKESGSNRIQSSVSEYIINEINNIYK